MKCTVYYNDTSVQPTPNKMSFFEELYFDYKVNIEKESQRLSLFVHPKQSIRLSKVVVEFPYQFKTSDKLFCNGFQSWTESRTYHPNDSIPRLRKLAQPYFQFYGDEHMFADKPPKLYSWTYGYINDFNQYTLIGSVQENTSFSLIEYDTESNVIRLIKKCDNIELDHSFPVFDLFVDKGSEKTVFDGYFKAIGPTSKKLAPTFGWTSWYRHYNKISESKILEDLEAFAKHTDEIPFNETDRIFQIDDGYQSAIGDWLNPSKDFANGLAKIASKIKAKGLKPGIWIAPFVCGKESKIFANQKDWILKDKNNKPLKAGYNPLWGGWYYALDFYNKQVKDYLTEVFYTFQSKWGFEIIKADFLFAACIAPPKNKTKGQVMHESMRFLDQLMGQNQLLACGVPLGSIFNLTSFCRIGPDTHLAWDHKLLRFLRKRERVSTIGALRTIIHRRHLNNKVFINDPDVFIMRGDGHKLSDTQQYTIMLIQVLFGNQIFNSDNWSTYDEEVLEEIKGLLAFRNADILSCKETSSDLFQISFKTKEKFTAYVNLSNRKINIDVLNLISAYELLPYESMVFKGIKES